MNTVGPIREYEHQGIVVEREQAVALVALLGHGPTLRAEVPEGTDPRPGEHWMVAVAEVVAAPGDFSRARLTRRAAFDEAPLRIGTAMHDIAAGDEVVVYPGRGVVAKRERT